MTWRGLAVLAALSSFVAGSALYAQGQQSAPPVEKRYETHVDGICPYSPAWERYRAQHPPTPGCAACEAAGVRCAVCEAKAATGGMAAQPGAAPAPGAALPPGAAKTTAAPGAPGDGGQATPPAQPPAQGVCPMCQKYGMMCPDCAAKKAKAEGRCPVCAARAAQHAIWEAEEARLRAEAVQRWAQRNALPEAWLGVDMEEGRCDTVFVIRVAAGSPAAAVGVQPGDKIIRYNNVCVCCAKEFAHRIARLKAGDKGILTVIRAGQWLNLEVTLGAAPQAQPGAPVQPQPQPQPKAQPLPQPQPGAEPPKEAPKDAPKGASKEPPKEAPKEAPKEMPPPGEEPPK